MSHQHSPSLTFSFVDLAGFTALTDVHGDHDAAHLVERFEAFVSDALDIGDRLVKTIGDAVMLVSESPTQGLQLVRRISDSCLDEPRFPAPRAGMHHGPAIERDGDYIGTTVNLAARVAAQAPESTAVVTAVIEPAARALGLPLIALGRQQLRNLSEPVDLWRLTLSDKGGPSYVDPVCRMRLREHEAVGRLRDGSEDLHFCSVDCLSIYVGRSSRPGPAASRDRR